MRIAFIKRVVFLFVMLVAVGLIEPISVTAQVPEHVPWSDSQPISWQLFLAPYPQDGCMQAEAAAIHMTLNWSVSYVIDYERSGGTWYGYVDRSMIEVTNTMEPLLSWAASHGTTADVLSHEQRHFDLNEVYARKLSSLLALPRATGTTTDEVRTTLKKRINDTASAVLETVSQMQSLYDDETVHGTNATIQASWATRIDGWLADPMQAP